MDEKVYIGLGGNVGDRLGYLRGAVEALRRIDAVSVTRLSSVYDSLALGPPQPRFLNAVAELECELEPRRLLAILQEIEREAGRRESARWAPRTLDLDVLLWGQRLVADRDLQVPHLELHKRRFVLEPLCELAEDALHPVLGEPLKALLARLPPQDVVRVGTFGFGDVFPIESAQ